MKAQENILNVLLLHLAIVRIARSAKEIEFTPDLKNMKDKPNPLVVASENDLILTGTQQREIFQNSIELLRYRWPSSTVPVAISEAFSPSEKMIIWGALEYIEANTCVRFIAARSIDHDIVQVTKRWNQPIKSYLGSVGGLQTINLHSVNEYEVLHQFMHTLGFPHQHVVSNRDENIKVIWDNISPARKPDFVKLGNLKNVPFLEEFDKESLMNYDRYTSTKNGKPTIEGDMAPSPSLTATDIKKINSFYGCFQ